MQAGEAGLAELADALSMGLAQAVEALTPADEIAVIVWVVRGEAAVRRKAANIISSAKSSVLVRVIPALDFDTGDFSAKIVHCQEPPNQGGLGARPGAGPRNGVGWGHRVQKDFIARFEEES